VVPQEVESRQTVTFLAFRSSYSVRTTGASVGSTHTLGPFPTTRDKPNLVRGAGAPAFSLLSSKLRATDAVDSKLELVDQRASRCQQNARLLVQSSQGLVSGALEKLDESTLSAVHFEDPEMRPDFAGHDIRGGDRILVGKAVRRIDEPNTHPQPPGFAHGALSASGHSKSRAR